jgi:hypothetical protein
MNAPNVQPRSAVNSSLGTRVNHIRHILGLDVVLLACRGKKPIRTGWQKKTLAQMSRDYLQRLENPDQNIGVLLGKNSNHLCAIDIDDDAEVEPFFQANASLRDSARVRGARGCKIFVCVNDDYPRKRKIYRNGKVIGDWLGNGAQAIVEGRHPDTLQPYRWECTAAPAVCSFGALALQNNPKSSYSSESTESELTERTEPEHTELLNLLNNIHAQEQHREQLATSEPFFKAYELFVEDRYDFAKGTRNATLVTAVTFLFRAFGEAEVIQLMTWLYELNADLFNDSLAQHLNEVRAHLSNCEQRFLEELSQIEAAFYVRLGGDLKAAFRICRDLALRSIKGGVFFLSCNELAGRLRKQSMVAYRILHRLQRLRIIEFVTPGIRGIGSRVATEYRWSLPPKKK